MSGVAPVAGGGRIASADLLRGLAALSVAWYHFTNGGPLLEDGWLRASGSHGWLGVHAFFVISGCVIPLSMHRAGYALRQHAGTFVLKRLIRLEPPYLLAVLLCAVLGLLPALVPGFAGAPFALDSRQLALHVGYLNGLFEVPWLNPVFWSLAIEFQFYLCMSILYPLLVLRRRWLSIALLAGAALSALALDDPDLVFHYAPLFAFGVIAFWCCTERIGARVFFVLAVLVAAIAMPALGAATTAVGAASALVLAFARWPVPRGLAFLGAISYSLYLLHVPVGGRVVNLGARVAEGELGRVLVLAAALLTSLLAAWLFFRLIERPAQHWAARVRYRAAAERAAAVAA
ncbi:MAG: acyltransferase family protein [Nevskiaceae bacterium]